MYVKVVMLQDILSDITWQSYSCLAIHFISGDMTEGQGTNTSVEERSCDLVSRPLFSIFYWVMLMVFVFQG